MSDETEFVYHYDQFMVPCYFSGPTFSPKIASEQTGLQFTDQTEIGEDMRYIKKKATIGYATLEPPVEFNEIDEIYAGLFWMIDTLTEHVDTLRACGADDIYINLGIIHHYDVKLEFEPDFLMKLAKLNIPFLISGYKEETDD